MSLIIHPYTKREILRCFSLEVYLPNKETDEIEHDVENAIVYNHAITAMLNGEIQPIDMLDLIEEYDVNPEQYIDEVIDNLEDVNIIV